MSDQKESVYRWEYSPLARIGNLFWEKAVDPALRYFADEYLKFLQRIRATIQIIVLIAAVVSFAAMFHSTARLLTISGILFDIAGALRLFLFEDIRSTLSSFKPNKHGDLPSVAMRELVMPEASGPYTAESDHISQFYYEKRGVLFLFVGFWLQLFGNLFS